MSFTIFSFDNSKLKTLSLFIYSNILSKIGKTKIANDKLNISLFIIIKSLLKIIKIKTKDKIQIRFQI